MARTLRQSKRARLGCYSIRGTNHARQQRLISTVAPPGRKHDDKERNLAVRIRRARLSPRRMRTAQSRILVRDHKTMTGITAHRKGDGRGFWRIGWIAAINGREIAGIKFATRAKAIAYAKRVAQY